MLSFKKVMTQETLAAISTGVAAGEALLGDAEKISCCNH
jgi:hypothetical protein